MEIIKLTKELIPELLSFERDLRSEEPEVFMWEIDEDYIKNLESSFGDGRFDSSAVSLLAYDGGRVVGRIDASLIYSRFDGTVSQAYLDWICVLKSERHKGVGRALLAALKSELKEMGVSSLMVLTAENGEAAAFYDNCDGIRFMRGAMIDMM
ncbi:MAG: GNAT family N-acetyltransferase [Eubacteriaceae bacterium]|nr:GNAT family N-acetyltransferase [Eubacteriaceae bacterium]